MNIFEYCEQKAIEYFKIKGVDISTREKRVVLPKETKQEVFNFLVNTYLDQVFMI